MALTNYKILGQVNTGAVTTLPVTNNALTSNVATLTTPVPHGIKAGDRAYVIGNTNTILNGSFLVSAVSSSANFSYPRTNANITSASTITTSVVAFTTPVGGAITNKSKTGGMATITIGSTSGISAGDYIDVYINDAAFDGSYIRVYDVPTGTTLRYVAVGADVTSAAVTSGAISVYSPQTMYTVPSGKEAIAASIMVSNLNGVGISGRFALYLVLSGESGTPDKSRIVPWTDLVDGEIISFTLGMSLSAGDKIVMRGLTPGLSATVTGTELSL